MSKLPFLLLAGIFSLLASACRTGGVSPVYDVVVVGGGPAGIGAALAAAETGARDRILAFIHRQKGLENVRLISSASEVGVREPSRLGLCSPRESAICWSLAVPFQVITALIPPSASKPLVWVWGRPRESQPPSPPRSAATPGTFP